MFLCERGEVIVLSDKGNLMGIAKDYKEVLQS